MSALIGGNSVVYPITPQLGGTGVANNVASTLTISGNFGITFAVTGTTAITLPESGALGDMLKSVYDPQNVGKISGSSASGGVGGVLTFGAGSGGVTNAAGGNINMSGGGQNSPSGQLDMGGGGGSNEQGGNIDTSSGGGAINTRGTGSIEFGVSATRTTLTGTATTPRAISLPDKAGTLAIDVADVEAASGIAPAADNTYASPTSITIVKGIITAIS